MAHVGGCLPNLVGSNVVVCNFRAEALFCIGNAQRGGKTYRAIFGGENVP